MAGEVKNMEAKKPAKKKTSPGVLALCKVVDDIYEQAREAKKRGEPVDWSSSKSLCEFTEALDLKVVYPENQAVGTVTNRNGGMLCQVAGDMGYGNDICGYTRISLVYAGDSRVGRKFDPVTGEFIINPASGKPLKDENGNVVIDPKTGKSKEDPKTQVPYEELVNINKTGAFPNNPEKEMRLKTLKPIRQNLMSMPDFILYCSNICDCMTEWYENIARVYNILLIMIDIPYNNDVEVDDSKVRYIHAQFDATIKQLEQISGKKFDEKKFEQVCANADRPAAVWLRVCDYPQHKLAPMSDLDLFNHMMDIVTARGKVETAEVFEQLACDLEGNVKEGMVTLPFPEKKRIMFEGILCWPKFSQLFRSLKENGINVMAVVHVPAFDFVYKDMDGMARAYYKASNLVCIEQGVVRREGICRDDKVDGVPVHYNHPCKPWSGYMAEMQRRFTKDFGIPTTGFDGDQVDPRNFSAVQYGTRVQGFMEAVEANEKNNETKEA